MSNEDEQITQQISAWADGPRFQLETIQRTAVEKDKKPFTRALILHTIIDDGNVFYVFNKYAEEYRQALVKRIQWERETISTLGGEEEQFTLIGEALEEVASNLNTPWADENVFAKAKATYENNLKELTSGIAEQYSEDITAYIRWYSGQT